MTVIPGYVSTKMTKMMKLPSFLTAKPDEIASYFVKALKKEKHNLLPSSMENYNDYNKDYT